MSTGLIASADLNAQLDDIGIALRKLAGSVASGFGVGEPGGAFGSASAIASLVASIYGSANLDEVDGMGPAARAFQTGMSSKLMFGAQVRNLVLAYSAHAVKFGPAGNSIFDLDGLLSYLNVGPGGPWAALQDANWLDIYFRATGLTPKPYNLYQEILSGAFSDGLNHQYVNGLGKLVVGGAYSKPVIQGVLIDDGAGGGTIDQTKCVGGFPQVRVSGLTGTGNVTVTALVFDPSTMLFSSKTYIFAVVANGVNNTVSGGTAAPNALPIVSTLIAAAGGISAGTITFEAARPAGRPIIQ